MNGGRESHSACFQAFHVAPLRASLKFEGALNPNIAPFAYLPYSLTALLWNRWTSYKEPCFRVASHRVSNGRAFAPPGYLCKYLSHGFTSNCLR